MSLRPRGYDPMTLRGYDEDHPRTSDRDSSEICLVARRDCSDIHNLLRTLSRGRITHDYFPSSIPLGFFVDRKTIEDIYRTIVRDPGRPIAFIAHLAQGMYSARLNPHDVQRVDPYLHSKLCTHMRKIIEDIRYDEVRLGQTNTVSSEVGRINIMQQDPVGMQGPEDTTPKKKVLTVTVQKEIKLNSSLFNRKPLKINI